MAPVEVEDLDVAYGDIQVVWGVSLAVRDDDEVVALIGPNGAGKTTILKTIAGLVPPAGGSVRVFGDDVAGLSTAEVVERGVVLVPEERNLFPRMTVRENLVMGAYPARAREAREETLETVYDLFPVLAERPGVQARNLSGGQQQMLAVGRGLMARPKVLALDEPSSGLAPQVTEDLFETVDRLRGDTVVFLVEQHVEHALGLADRAYVLENGQVVTEGTGREVLDSDHVREAYLSG